MKTLYDKFMENEGSTIIPDRQSHEVMSIIVVSTAHLTKDEGTKSIDAFPLAGMEWDYGFIFYIADYEWDDDEIEDNPGLYQSCMWAISLGFDWLRFDSDALQEEGLPVYQW